MHVQLLVVYRVQAIVTEQSRGSLTQMLSSNGSSAFTRVVGQVSQVERGHGTCVEEG